MAKIFDLVVSTGSYTNAQGETKKRFKNVGACMQGQDGGMFLLLDKTFNPAGVPGDDEACLISMYEPKQRQQPQQQSASPLPQDLGPNGGYQGDVPF